jgi:hypothetical protein
VVQDGFHIYLRVTFTDDTERLQVYGDWVDARKVGYLPHPQTAGLILNPELRTRLAAANDGYYYAGRHRRAYPRRLHRHEHTKQLRMREVNSRPLDRVCEYFRPVEGPLAAAAGYRRHGYARHAAWLQALADANEDAANASGNVQVPISICASVHRAGIELASDCSVSDVGLEGWDREWPDIEDVAIEVMREALAEARTALASLIRSVVSDALEVVP